MALSKKNLTLLKRIYDHFDKGRQVTEDPDLALEYVLKEITDTLNLRSDQGYLSPLPSVMDMATGQLAVKRMVEGFNNKKKHMTRKSPRTKKRLSRVSA